MTSELSSEAVEAVVILMHCSYDKDAPTRVGAKHIPSFVLILCTVFVRGLIHAASLVSRVIKPYKGKFIQVCRRQMSGSKPGWMVSKIFFLGLSCDRGAWSKGNHEMSIYLNVNLVRVPSYSGPSKYTLSPGLELGGGWIISIPPSFPSLEVA
jgi:hypothetical protein